MAATLLTNGVNIPCMVPTPLKIVPVVDIIVGKMAVAMLDVIRFPIFMIVVINVIYKYELITTE